MLLAKDIRLEWRSKDALNAMLFFSLLVVVIFMFSFDPLAEESRHIVGNHRMIAAEHRAKLAGALDRARNRALVEVIAEQVDSVGAGEIVKPVAIEVGEQHALRRLNESGRIQVTLHQLTELEWDPISVSELQIGDTVLGARGEPHRDVADKARKTHGGLGSRQKDRQGTLKTGSIVGPDVIVGRDVPDESKERHTEIAVEAGRTGGEHRDDKR